MSDLPSDYRARIDLPAILMGLDRSRAETQKLLAEQQKLTAEQQKLTAEQQKLMAEAAKLKRDYWLAPWALFLSVIGGVIVAVLTHFWK